MNMDAHAAGAGGHTAGTTSSATAPSATTSVGATGGASHFFLNALRIVTGLLFWFHGAQKLLGWFGAEGTAAFPSLMFWAGILEFVGGILIAIGLFTRPVAFILAGEMAVAYLMVHLGQGFWPIENGGELAALYCFIYLFLAANGGGAFSVDGALAGRSRNRVVE